MLDLKSSLGDRADVYLAVDCGAPLTEHLVAAVTGVCDQVEDRDADAVVVLHVADTSAPDYASTAWPGDAGVHLVNKWEGALRRLERLAAPIIAVAEGPCGGPAIEVLLAADYRIGTADASLRLPGRQGEVWPGMALHRLTTQIGVARARRLVLFGIELSAGEAEAAGLLDEVTVDVAEAVDAATKMADGLAGSELAIRRRLLLDASTTGFEEALGTHLAACDRMLRRTAY